MGIVLTPEHSAIVDSCRAYCQQAVTYHADGQDFRANNLLMQAYLERNEFPIGTPAYDLCQNVINQAEKRMQRENRHNMTREETLIIPRPTIHRIQ